MKAATGVPLDARGLELAGCNLMCVSMKQVSMSEDVEGSEC